MTLPNKIKSRSLIQIKSPLFGSVCFSLDKFPFHWASPIVLWHGPRYPHTDETKVTGPIIYSHTTTSQTVLRTGRSQNKANLRTKRTPSSSLTLYLEYSTISREAMWRGIRASTPSHILAYSPSAFFPHNPSRQPGRIHPPSTHALHQNSSHKDVTSHIALQVACQSSLALQPRAHIV